MSKIEMLEEFQMTLSQKLHDAGCHDLGKVHEVDQVFDPDTDSVRLCAALIEEEAEELLDAIPNGDIAHILKEASDLLYVVYGFCAKYGFPIDEAFRRVHANNMAKIVNGSFSESGKLTKPKDHPKVDLSDLAKEFE
jgi:predicted HAD superfamily Cof-like phosphohydrolase